MDVLHLTCGTLSELGSLLERENKIFIGLVKEVWLGGHVINLLTVIETKEGNEMKTLRIFEGSLSKIEPLLESEEKLCLGEIGHLVFAVCKIDGMEKTIKENFGTRNNVRNSWEISEKIGNQDMGKMILLGFYWSYVCDRVLGTHKFYSARKKNS